EFPGAREQLICADVYDVDMFVLGRFPEAKIKGAALRRDPFDIHGMIRFSKAFAVSGELAEFAVRIQQSPQVSPVIFEASRHSACVKRCAARRRVDLEANYMPAIGINRAIRALR